MTEPPASSGPDMIDSDDPDVLRAEILRLRDQLMGADGRLEVRDDRIAELERIETWLNDRVALLQADLDRRFDTRVRDALRRRLGREG